MSKFVNYGKRGFTLPPGCKDLIDVLQQGGAPQPIKSIASASEQPAVTRGSMTIARLSEVPSYIDRLVNSRSVLVTLMISTLDKCLSIVLFLDESKGLSALALVSNDAERERGIREFLQRHDMALLHDHLVPADAGAEPVRSLMYSLPPAPPQASQITTELFRTVYHCTDESKIRFQYYDFG